MADLLNLKRGASDIGDLVNVVAGATITVGADTGSAVAVQVQLTDWQGEDLAYSGCVHAYLSDNADGSTLAGTAPDTVAAGTDGLVIELVADKVFMLVSESDGDIDIAIGEDGADTWYLVVILPGGRLVVSDAITFTA